MLPKSITAEPDRGASLHLDAAALRHNVSVARAAAPDSRVMAATKAQGYGHGLKWVAETIRDQVDGFAVASVSEGIALRDLGIGQPVCILDGPLDTSEIELAATRELDLVIHQAWQLEALRSALPASVGVWLKVDSGMGRLGVRPQEAADFHAALTGCAAVRGAVGLMTHMARADDRDDNATREQWTIFAQATAGLTGPRSAANSACVMGWSETHGDWVRPGIMLYGCSPFITDTTGHPDLLPVMTLTSRLIAINAMPRGAPIGYGSTWRCPENMRIGVAAIGYGDGYPRGIANGTPVLVDGQRAAIVGRVSMDKVTIDLRTVPAAEIGSRVTLWGEGLPVEEIAASAGTIGYELFTGVYGRVPVRR